MPISCYIAFKAYYFIRSSKLIMLKGYLESHFKLTMLIKRAKNI